jgi:tetratricopeptide (TPR) repeat protein
MKLLPCIVIFFAFGAFGQSSADSLWAVWQDEDKADTVRLLSINKLIWDHFLFTQPDSAYTLAKEQYKLAKEKGSEKHVAGALKLQGISSVLRGNNLKAIEYFEKSKVIKTKLKDFEGVSSLLNNLGICHKNLGNYEIAIAAYDESMRLSMEQNDEVGTAKALINKGVVYKLQGNYAKAIQCYNQNLKISEEQGNKKGVSVSYNNIGNIYKEQGDFEKAIEYFKKCLKTDQEIGNKIGMSSSYKNIGLVYFDFEEYDKALDFAQKGLQLEMELGDKNGVAASYNNIGSIYKNKGNIDEALNYYLKALEIWKSNGIKRNIAGALLNIGTVYDAIGDKNKALNYYTESLTIAEEIGVAMIKSNVYQKLWRVNKALGRYKKSLEMYEFFIATRDSLESEKNQKEVIRQEYKYEYEKQAAADSVKAAEAKKVIDAQLQAEKLEARQQRQQNYFLFGGLAIALIFGGFIFNRFQITRKQRDLIEKQKETVDQAFEKLGEKNREILDSINYAKRIQSAILPPQKLVKQYLPESFILYKPKDIVAGDFYWVESLANTVLFAAADCTGHGVPGALVSVVCNNGLNRSVREYGLKEPSEILDKTREIVIAEFEKSEEDVKDGMDIAVCSLNGKELHYAGANNPIWIIRKDSAEVEEIKADKQPIGKFGAEAPFTNHKILLSEGDTVYIFSDGFADQFGGDKGKKYKSGKFKQLLLSVQKEKMEQQRKLIDDAFEQWRGSLEQLDDVCVIGVKIE